MTLSELLVKISADVSSYTTGIDRAVADTARIESTVGKAAASFDTVTASLSRLGSSLTSIGAGLTAAVTLPFAGIGIAALKMSSDLETAKIAFTTLMGSAQAAQKHLDELRVFAAKTPFAFPDLIEASKRLQAMGFSAQQIMPVLNAVGNAAAALGTGAQGIERISTALGQMQAKGKVSAEEMKQLAEAGISAWQMLADQLTKVQGRTVTVAETMKMAERGMINGAAAVGVLVDAMDHKFGGLMEKQSQTLAGMFSNLKDKLGEVLAQIGDVLSPLAKSLVGAVTDMLPAVTGLVEQFGRLPQPVQAAALGFGVAAAAAGPLLLVFGQLANATSGAIKAFQALSAANAGSALGGISTQATTATAALTKLGAAGVAIGVAFMTFQDAKASFGELTAAINAHLFSWDSLVAKVKSAASTVVELVNDAFGGAVDVILRFGRALVDMIPPQALVGLQGFVGSIGSLVSSLGEGLKRINLGESIKATLGPLAALSGLWRAIRDDIEFIAGKYAVMDEALRRKGSDIQKSNTDMMRKAAEDAMKAHGTGGAATTLPSLLNPPSAEKAAKEAAKKVQDAFAAFGLRDMEAELERLSDAWVNLWYSGKASTEQLAEAWKQLQSAVEETYGATQEFASYFNAKPFDVSSLGNMSEVISDFLGANIDRAAIKLQRDQDFADMTKYIDDMAALQVRAAKEAAELARMYPLGGAPTAESVRAGLPQSIQDNLPVTSNVPTQTALDRLKAIQEQAALLADIQKNFADAGPAAGLLDPKTLAAIQAGLNGIAGEMEAVSSKMDALGKLGVVSEEALDSAVNKARAAYQTILESATASDRERKESWLAVIDSQIASNDHLSASTIANYLRISESIRNGPQQQMLNFAREVNNAMRGMFDDLHNMLANNILEWDDWGKKFKDIGLNLAKDMLQIFIKELFNPLEQILTKWVTTAATKVGETFRMFGGGSKQTPAPAVPSGGASTETPVVPGTAQDVALGKANTLTADNGGGLLGSLGDIGSIGALISNIIQNVQIHSSNKKLDDIRDHTLRMFNEISNLRTDEWTREDHWFRRTDEFMALVAAGFGDLFLRLGDIWSAIAISGGLVDPNAHVGDNPSLNEVLSTRDMIHGMGPGLAAILAGTINGRTANWGIGQTTEQLAGQWNPSGNPWAPVPGQIADLGSAAMDTTSSFASLEDKLRYLVPGQFTGLADSTVELTAVQKQLIAMGYSLSDALGAVVQNAQGAQAKFADLPPTLTSVQQQLLDMGYSMSQVIGAVVKNPQGPQVSMRDLSNLDTALRGIAPWGTTGPKMGDMYTDATGAQHPYTEADLRAYYEPKTTWRDPMLTGEWQPMEWTPPTNYHGTWNPTASPISSPTVGSGGPVTFNLYGNINNRDDAEFMMQQIMAVV